MKIRRLGDIPQFPRAGYEVSVPWASMQNHVSSVDFPFIMEPDYQRGHVWNDEQRSAFIEYGLMGGESSMVITTNCPGWMGDWRGPYELVDGLQRVTAVLKFLKNEVKAFGLLLSEFEDKLRPTTCPTFRWRVMNLPTRAEVLNLYLLMNSGGVVHSAEEIARVRSLLEEETK